ncbi:GAF domain-containing protein [Caulobacter sp. SLTY]|uniref:histidine kinase dimerization/phosphoacceptor domain -containing protein n=1 Tax=Caulobacter sp. SLTY TaxID=2683262 RepID=UPI00141280D1|nr:histidine kinase dimerization/phosphoacceptor domain -containing protein [Caulobacter sp. SLTY]NBB16869.1 GAF domain-containing protein [Caulobacter sp. SLTY]
MTDTVIPTFDPSAPDLTDCDREPIHIPGTIQPHGLLLVVERNSLSVVYGAGDIETRLTPDWQGASLGALLGDDLAGRIARLADSTATGAYIGQAGLPSGHYDVSAHPSADFILVELEPSPDAPAPAATVLGALESAGRAFERTSSLKGLCERAAEEFAKLTGYDRVMIYRFLDDDAGMVIAEYAAEGMAGFLNHHFPSTDIPKQARALYVRNLVRVIPDVGYTPAPLRPAWAEANPLDMSDCGLRSVSPIHVQYLKNMGVGASASISIVKDGVLWGLVACHHPIPREIPYDMRAASRALAGGLARQIKGKEEADRYRERIRLRGIEDEVLHGLSPTVPLDEALADAVPHLRRMLAADGAAIYRGGTLTLEGECPPESAVREMAGWLVDSAVVEPFHSDRWAEQDPRVLPWKAVSSGVMAATVSADEPFVLLWFRAEQVQVVNWAGNPHKAVSGEGVGTLTPRASFEAWSETVAGRARPWTPAEVDAVARLRGALLEIRHNRRLRDLNGRLSETLADREALLAQKDFLIREVNHRVQNSLQLVSSFLGLQRRASSDEDVQASLEEAQRRISAVALVHRRLYRADQVETVDLARYLEELVGDMQSSMGGEWEGQLSLSLAPITVATDRAVTIGLVLTELVINANKYAYGGQAGPIEIALEQHRDRFRLIVADRGKGKTKTAQGFGSRMMAAMVAQLQGELEHTDNHPGLRNILIAPLKPRV